MRVWIVEETRGEYSDLRTDVESIWATDSGAISHIVNDIGAEYDGVLMGEFRWEVNEVPDWAEEAREDGYDPGEFAELVTYSISPHHVRGLK